MTTRRAQIDGYPAVMLKCENSSCYRILHEATGTFRVHIKRRTERVTTVNGWGFDVHNVSKWRWAVGYQVGAHIRYIHAFHDFENRADCLNVGIRIAVEWINADDRRETWARHLRAADGDYGDRVLESSEEMGRAITGESGWD